jgi:hypothetical protein
MALTKATNSMISGAPINVLDYGADPTGVADSLAAFDAAVAAGSQIVIPVGIYKLTGTWAIPQGKTIIGLGDADVGYYGRAQLVPTAAVTGAAIELEGTANWLTNIYVDGAATTGVIGLRIGNVPLANLCFVDSVECNNFKGVGGKGLQIINTVGTYFNHCRFNANQENADIGTLSTGGCPTTTVFNECFFREAVGTGVVIRSNFQLTFNNCLWEANFNAGMQILGTGGYTCVGVTVNGGWCEDNWRSLVAPARTAESHFIFVGTGGDVENVTVNGTLFSGSATSERAIKATTIFDLLINAPITSVTGGASMISTISCSGWMQNWRNSNSSGWSNTGGSMFSSENKWIALDGAWTAWTPSYSAGGSMIFGTVTTTARYKLNGKTLIAEIYFTGTTSGSAGTNLQFTLPTGISAKNSSYTPAVILDTGTLTTGYLRFDGTNTVGAYIMSGNYALGANTGASCAFTIEII